MKKRSAACVSAPDRRRSFPATTTLQARSSPMIKIKPDPKPKDGPKQAAENESTKHIAENAVHGGPKDVKKDKRSGAGRGQKG